MKEGQSAAKPEIWSTIKDYPQYAVSTYGRVKSLRTGRILQTYCEKRTYDAAALHMDGKRKDMKVHRLVAMAFIPRVDEKKDVVNHKDHNTHNNHVENLEWCTSSENAIHSYENGRRAEEYHTVRKDIQSKMIAAVERPVLCLDKEGHVLASYKSASEASRVTGISGSLISAVCLKKYGRKTGGGYRWEFLEGSTTKCEENPTSTAQDTEK